MKLSTETKQQIISQLDSGMSVSAVAAAVGAPWHQVMYWNMNRARVAKLVAATDLKSVVLGRTGSSPVPRTNEYAYLLGMYLGDGYVSRQGKYTWRIRFSCDKKYPGIVAALVATIESIGCKGHVAGQSTRNSVDVFAYSNSIPSLFPQHGPGKKHARNITLEPWQLGIVQDHPQSFLRGLYHADGSRYIHRQGGREYVKYNFTNRSKQIIDLFCDACALCGITYRINSRPFKAMDGSASTGWTVTIGKRSEVLKCESVLGVKQ